MPPQELLMLPFLTRKMLGFEYATKIQIQIITLSNQTSSIFLHGITREGQFTYRHITDGTGTQKIENFDITDIPILLSLDDTTDVFTPGGLFASISLLINGTKIYQFFSGFVEAKSSLSWPATQRSKNVFIPGNLITLSSSDPAAGLELNYTVPNPMIMKIRALRFTLVAAAAAASRRVHVVLTVAGIKVYDIISNTDQIISETKTYSCVAGGNGSAQTNDNDIYVPLPNEVTLNPGDQISTETFNLNAGDDYGIMTVYAESMVSDSAI